MVEGVLMASVAVGVLVVDIVEVHRTYFFRHFITKHGWLCQSPDTETNRTLTLVTVPEMLSCVVNLKSCSQIYEFIQICFTISTPIC